MAERTRNAGKRIQVNSSTTQTQKLRMPRKRYGEVDLPFSLLS